ncbi:hypothetical protein AB0869_22160 [Micromonospora vinacea]|uniref:hypothetical protein n=1 Tax=Micromonospora vinacea TaxID=709878 RepID=UPI003455BF2F
MTVFNSGDVVLIGSACSVQFSGERALRLRLVSVGGVDPYDGWVWLTGYVLDAKGTATDKREVYVQRAGIVVEQKRPGAPKVGRSDVPTSSQARASRTGVLEAQQSALRERGELSCKLVS